MFKSACACGHSLLEIRRRACRDHGGRTTPSVAESMRLAAVEEKRVAGLENPNLPADGEFDFPRQHHAAFVRFVFQHALASVRAWLVHLMQDLEIVRARIAHLSQSQLAVR